VNRILVGTASWTDPTLVKDGHFYPPEAKSAEARLRFYADQFPIVEVDSTYYFPPSEKNAVLWIDRTPKDFTFNIKAYSLLTNHPTKRESLYKDDALMPLHSAGKLGAVLFQFPQWFVIGRRNKDYILECAERLKDFRLAIEFRHKTWLEERNAEETLSFLEEHDLPLVCVDMPQGFDSSIPPIAAATAKDLALVRFHGRDREVWAKKNVSASERFRYEYSEQELKEWVPRIRDVSGQARETHVLMNNCYRDFAVNNARQLADLLEE
jgi:uncharacterized protein YecE (DUF72 family)